MVLKKGLLSIEPSLLLPIGSVRPVPFLRFASVSLRKTAAFVHRRALFCPKGAPKRHPSHNQAVFDFPFAGSRSIPPQGKDRNAAGIDPADAPVLERPYDRRIGILRTGPAAVETTRADFLEHLRVRGGVPYKNNLCDPKTLSSGPSYPSHRRALQKSGRPRCDRLNDRLDMRRMGAFSSAVDTGIATIAKIVGLLSVKCTRRIPLFMKTQAFFYLLYRRIRILFFVGCHIGYKFSCFSPSAVHFYPCESNARTSGSFCSASFLPIS